MARPYKQMAGISYHTIYQSDRSIKVECTYLCPYCNQYADDFFEVGEDLSSQLEMGGFFENLQCNHCGKRTDVRFWKCNKI